MQGRDKEAAMSAKCVQKDNGYFEVWRKPDGSLVRFCTEDRQLSLKRPGARAAFAQATRERLSV
jgi:hypothetical protein